MDEVAFFHRCRVCDWHCRALSAGGDGADEAGEAEGSDEADSVD